MNPAKVDLVAMSAGNENVEETERSRTRGHRDDRFRRGANHGGYRIGGELAHGRDVGCDGELPTISLRHQAGLPNQRCRSVDAPPER